MTYDPNLDFDTDIEQLSPQQAKDRVESVTNMTVAQARALKNGPRFDEYNDRASGQETTDPPIEGGPTEDFLHLKTTPADEWGDDEIEEANELVNYAKRTVPQYGPDEGKALLPDQSPDIHKGEMALATWGIDMGPADGWPGGGGR